MKIIEVERVIHVETYDVGLYYSVALHLQLNCNDNFMTFACDEFTKEERKYLSAIIGYRVLEIDSLCIYLKNRSI